MQLAGIVNGLAERGMTVFDGDCDVVLARRFVLAHRRSAQTNKEGNLHHTVIPSTTRNVGRGRVSGPAVEGICFCLLSRTTDPALRARMPSSNNSMAAERGMTVSHGYR
jgi:hypothetical protein